MFKTVHIVESDGFPHSAYACHRKHELLTGNYYRDTVALRNAIAARATEGGIYPLADEAKAAIVAFCKDVSAGNIGEYHKMYIPKAKIRHHVTVWIRDCSTSHPFELVQY